jgi:hypothetical protein
LCNFGRRRAASRNDAVRVLAKQEKQTMGRKIGRPAADSSSARRLAIIPVAQGRCRLRLLLLLF